jgi:hypothetical protein
MARVDLGPRTSAECHKLVKCPTAWTPNAADGPHQCLVVRVSAIGDTVNSQNSFDPRSDRHVAQRNVSVVDVRNASAANIAGLMDSLQKTTPPGATVQLHQVGAEGANAVRLVAPNHTIDPAVTSLVLAELGADGSLRMPAPMKGAGPLQVARMVPANLLGLTGTTAVAPNPVVAAPKPVMVAPRIAVPHATSEPIELAKSGGTIATLLDHTSLLDPATLARVPVLKPPGPGLAQVLRIVCHQGTQVVGGYTLVFAG